MDVGGGGACGSRSRASSRCASEADLDASETCSDAGGDAQRHGVEPPAAAAAGAPRPRPGADAGAGDGGGGGREAVNVGGAVEERRAGDSTPAASSSEPRTKKKAPCISFNASHSDYEAVAAAAEARGWKLVKSGEKANNCNVHWIDDGTIGDWFKKVEPWMRVNHFPGMNNALARKTRLARNMARMQRLFSKAYQFLPPTWVLPDDLADLERRFGPDAESKLIYIVKPDHLCQGKGIFLTTELRRLKNAAVEMRTKNETAVVQRYITRPLLIEGLKFDLRLYFLVAGKLNSEGGLDMRCFLFRDGLVRLCTAAYEAPTAETMDNKCMHLTNYAVNKHSSDFQANTSAEEDGTGSKRSLRWFLKYIEETHGEKERRKLWLKLMGLCVKTVLTVQPTLEGECLGAFPKDLSGGQMGWRCFEVLGIDVMLDAKRKPYLIEINHLPSFTTDSPLDEDIKRRLLDQVLELTCGTLTARDRKIYEQLARERREAGAAGATAAQPAGPSQENDPGPEAQSLLDADEYKDFERAYPPPESAAKLVRECQQIAARVQELFQPVHQARRGGAAAARHPSRDAAAAAAAAAAPATQRPPPMPPGAARAPAAPAPQESSRRSPSPKHAAPSHATSPTATPPPPPMSSSPVSSPGRGRSGAPPAVRSHSAPLPRLTNAGLPPIPGGGAGGLGGSGGLPSSASAAASPRPPLPTGAVAAAMVASAAAARRRSRPSAGGERPKPPARSLSRKSSAPRVFLSLKSAQISL